MLIVACFGLIAIASVVLARGRLSALAEIRLRHAWLVWIALGAQVVTMGLVPDAFEGLHEPVHMVTYVLAGAFLWANRSIPWLWLVGLGGAANFAAIAANGGVMPAPRGALEAAGLSTESEGFVNSRLVEDSELTLLGDVFAIPSSWPLSTVFSIGDLCIAVGLLAALHVTCRSRLALVAPPGELRDLVRERGFARLWAAQAASSIGDFVYSIAVAVTVIDEGMGASVLATILIVQAAPAAVTGLLGAPLIDRFSRRRLMVLADVVRAAAVGSLLVAPSPSAAHILVVAACLGCFGAIFQPAMHASLPNMVAPRLLLTANAAISATFHLAVLVGPLVGGLLATYGSADHAFAFNAATFVVSGVLLAGMRIPQATTEGREEGTLQSLREGIRYVATNALVRGVVVTAGVAMFAAAIRQPLEPLLVARDLGGAAKDIGLAAGAWGLGMLAGSCSMPALASRLRRETLMAAGLLAMGVAILLASGVDAVGTLLLLWLLGGFGNATLTVAYETLLQQRTPDRLRGRVVAANEAGLDAAMVAGLVVAGSVAGLVGTRGLMAVSGVLLLMAAGLAVVMLRRGSEDLGNDEARARERSMATRAPAAAAH